MMKQEKEIIEFYESVIDLYASKRDDATIERDNMFQLIMKYVGFIEEKPRKELLEELLEIIKSK